MTISDVEIGVTPDILIFALDPIYFDLRVRVMLEYQA